MLVSLVLQGTGSTGFFSSRAFMPAFMSALLLHYAPDAEWMGIAGSSLFEDANVTEIWFTSDAALLILGVMALGEFLAMHNTDLRSLIREFEAFPKGAMAAITYLAMAGAVEPAFTGEALVLAGIGDLFPALAIGGVTFWTASLQRNFKQSLYESDEDDNLGVQRMFTYAEDAWALLGPWILLIYPLLVLVLIGAVVGLLMLAKRRAAVKEERSRVSCTSCGELMYSSAVACQHCKTANQAPHAIGFLGQTKVELAKDRDDHPHQLVEKKRCPVCATRFKKHQVQQICTACGHELMQDETFVNRYIKRIDRRVPKVLVITFLLSLVPIVGLIPAIIYYRMQLVAPFLVYIPRSSNMLYRWGLRILYLILIAFQWVPGVGGLVAPVMAFSSYRVYRYSYKSYLTDTMEASVTNTAIAGIHIQ